jgi:hypothetical protein
MRLRKTLTVVGALALGVSLFAQGPRRDGKWEVKMDMAMAGMTLPTQTMTHCVTPQQAADPLRAVPQGGPGGRGGPGADCKVSDYKIEGSKVSWTMTCPQMTGTGEFLYAGETYTGTMKMSMQGQEMTMKYSGKRLGDCTE